MPFACKAIKTIVGYNKRNPKKGIERVWIGFSLPRLEAFGVTTKEIPKRELRVAEQMLLSFSRIRPCYNKRNPKKGIESCPFTYSSSICAVMSYNKRNPKKGIESTKSYALATHASPSSYNKRNPKKGIERSSQDDGKQWLPQRVTTKEIPKRELRGRHWR